jgi:hypothetical protein
VQPVRDVVTEKFDRWNQHEIREYAACAHDGGDPWANDIADAEQSWFDRGGD